MLCHWVWFIKNGICIYDLRMAQWWLRNSLLWEVKPLRLEIRILDLVFQTRWCSTFWTVGPLFPWLLLQLWIQRLQNSMPRITWQIWCTELHMRIIGNLWLVTRDNCSVRRKVDWRGKFHVSVKWMHTASSVVLWMVYSMQQYFCVKAFIFYRRDGYFILSFVCFYFFSAQNVLPWIFHLSVITRCTLCRCCMPFCRLCSWMKPVVIYYLTV